MSWDRVLPAYGGYILAYKKTSTRNQASADFLSYQAQMVSLWCQIKWCQPKKFCKINGFSDYSHILPWHTNRIFVMSHISLHKSPNPVISTGSAIFPLSARCPFFAQISINLYKFSGKWCSSGVVNGVVGGAGST